jgi:hypothetical protein
MKSNKDSLTKKAGDALERTGEKISRAGDKLEHSKDKSSSSVNSVKTKK